MYRTKIFSIMLSAVFAILIFGTFSYGGVPQMINYQGTLTDEVGTTVVGYCPKAGCENAK